MKIVNKLISVAFLLMGIFVLVFNQKLYHNLDFMMISVGIIMIVTRLSDLICMVAEKKTKKESMLFLNKIFTILIGVMTLFLIRNVNRLVVFSVLWSVWKIMSESEEIHEKALKNTDCKLYCIFNILESIIVIIYSIILIFNPTHDHLFDHMMLFAVELILEFLFPIFLRIEKESLEKRKQKADGQ